MEMGTRLGLDGYLFFAADVKSNSQDEQDDGRGVSGRLGDGDKFPVGSEGDQSTPHDALG